MGDEIFFRMRKNLTKISLGHVQQHRHVSSLIFLYKIDHKQQKEETIM